MVNYVPFAAALPIYSYVPLLFSRINPPSPPKKKNLYFLYKKPPQLNYAPIKHHMNHTLKEENMKMTIVP